MALMKMPCAVGGGSVLNPTLIYKTTYNNYGVTSFSATVGKTYVLVDNSGTAFDITNLDGADELLSESMAGFIMGSSTLVTGFVKVLKATKTTVSWSQSTSTFNMIVLQLD